MSDIYRTFHLGIFPQLLIETTEEGFIYGGRFYSISDVKEVRLAGGQGSPGRMGIHLSDGNKILINSGVLELNGKKYKNGFISGTNEAFEKLKSYFATSNL